MSKKPIGRPREYDDAGHAALREAAKQRYKKKKESKKIPTA